MTRYNEDTWANAHTEDGYREGVDRVLEYIESIHAYPKLMSELKWAIEEGII